MTELSNDPTFVVPDTAVALPSTPPWYAAQLKPNGLALAERNLLRQGFACFAPYITESRPGRGRRRKPLFPGYIFIGVRELIPHWAQIHATRGVTRLIAGNPYAPTAVPDNFISALRARCSSEGALIRGPDGLRVGMQVRVQRGPFTDIVARIEELSADDRVTLLLDMMGQATRVRVPRADVDRTSGAPASSA